MKRKRITSRYSRTGCIECKNSHSKCNEKKPRCSRCAKKGSSCVYEPQFIHHVIENRGKETKSSGKKGCTLNSETKDGVLTNSLNTSLRKRTSYHFSNELLDIKDFVYISPLDIDVLEDSQLEITDLQRQKNSCNCRNLELFRLSWRNTSFVKRFQTVSNFDPVKPLAQNCELGIVPNTFFHDNNLLNFVWTFMSCTRCACNFVLFPHDKFDNFMRILLKINSCCAIIESVLKYESSLLMEHVYEFNGLSERANAWNRYIRLPSLRSCLKTLEDRINSPASYPECVALTFTVIILFSANSANRSTVWRTHLKGSLIMLNKLEGMQPKKNLTDTDLAAIELHEILKDIFCHAELLANITSDNGGSIYRPEKLQRILESAPYSSINLLNDQFDLFRGYVSTLSPIFCNISLKLLQLRDRGINLSGSNLLKFRFLNKDLKVSDELRSFGIEVLNALDSAKLSKEELKITISEVEDFRLQLSMKCSNSLYFLALTLYLKVFFINTPAYSEDILGIIEDMLETAYSMPYYNTAAIACHWAVYLGALVSTVIDQANLFQHFIDILQKLAENGLLVAANSIERLNYISKVMSEKNYDALVNGDHDFIVL